MKKAIHDHELLTCFWKNSSCHILPLYKLHHTAPFQIDMVYTLRQK